MNTTHSPQRQLTLLKSQANQLQLSLLSNRAKDETSTQKLNELNQQIAKIERSIIKAELANAKDLKSAFTQKQAELQQKQHDFLYQKIIHTLTKDLSVNVSHHFCGQMLMVQEHFQKLHQDKIQQELKILQEIYEEVKKERKEFYINEVWLFITMIVVGLMFLCVLMIFGYRFD